MAKYFGINVNQKFTRKEIDIVSELDLFCESANIRSKHIRSCHNHDKSHHEYYYIDYYLLDYNLAIEIDEFNHKDRDPKYENKRESFLKKKLNCKFIRCNPDDPNFSISGLIGQIYKEIINR